MNQDTEASEEIKGKHDYSQDTMYHILANKLIS
jgi:hypothetical protein